MSKPLNKKVTAIGLAAGLLAGAGAGLALELSGSAGASNSANVMVAADSSTNPGPGAMPGAPMGRGVDFTAVLKPLVDDGTLTQEQADKVVAALQAAAPQGGPGMGGRGGRGMGAAHLDIVATVLGITADEVRTAVQGGQTIADLAKANGKTAQDVIDALVADVEQHFADEVASGEHTQAEADARIAEATTHITEFVNNTQAAMAEGDHGHRGHHGPGMGDDMMGDDMGGDVVGGTIDGGPADTGTTAP
ncbi:MAG: hypothetical protein RI900_238 [Actinomycetota bacterium]|jgi:hypothetical protein